MPEPPVTLRRLLPEPGLATVAQALADVDLGARAPADRPYLVLNMVATADGCATIAGRTAPMSDEADRQLFHGLRTLPDAVMVGAGTLREERYGRLVRDPALRAERARRGLAEDPLAVIVSGSLNLPADLPLLADRASRVLIVTASERELEPCPARVDYLRAPAGAALDLRAALGRLRAEHGVRSVLCEGGPSLNASLLPAGLVDELFLSIAPKLAGATGALTIVAGAPLTAPVGLELVWLLESGGQLFARYALGGSGSI